MTFRFRLSSLSFAVAFASLGALSCAAPTPVESPRLVPVPTRPVEPTRQVVAPPSAPPVAPSAASSTPDAPKPDEACHADGECIVVANATCCGCPHGPRAVLERAWKAQMELCKAESCPTLPSCLNLPASPGRPTSKAACRAGECVLVDK